MIQTVSFISCLSPVMIRFYLFCLWNPPKVDYPSLD